MSGVDRSDEEVDFKATGAAECIMIVVILCFFCIEIINYLYSMLECHCSSYIS